MNLQGALLGANASGIGGRDGYAWIAGELGSADPEQLIRGLSTPPELLRPLLFGWLVLLLDALDGERRATFEAAFANVDPRYVYDPLVRLPAAGFAPPRSSYDAFAYDAVWATALGIAAWRTNRSAGILSGIRASRFLGASGPVSFDNATGDRAPAGLFIRLMNIRASRENVSDWLGARLAMSQIGVFELLEGARPRGLSGTGRGIERS